MKLSTIAGFIRQKYPPTRKWKWGTLLSWLKWHDERKLVSIVVDDNGKLSGVGIVRCLHDKDEGYEHYIHYEDGQIAFVELIIANEPQDINTMAIRFVKRFSMRPALACKKYHASGNEIFTYETTKYLRRIL